MHGLRMGGLVVVLALGSPTAVMGAQAQTCAQGYLLCLNEAAQAEDGRTWKELSCLRGYAGCMKDQAFGS